MPLVRDRVDHRQHDVAVRQLGDNQLLGTLGEELGDAWHQVTPMWPDAAGASPVGCGLIAVAFRGRYRPSTAGSPRGAKTAGAELE